jgi:hypothetical protein
MNTVDDEVLMVEHSVRGQSSLHSEFHILSIVHKHPKVIGLMPPPFYYTLPIVLFEP